MFCLLIRVWNVIPKREIPPLNITLTSYFRSITFPILTSWQKITWKVKNSPIFLITLGFGSPAHNLGIIRILGLEKHPKKNSSRKWNKYLIADSQHTKYLPPAITTSLKNWKFGSRNHIIATGSKILMFSKWESQNPYTLTLGLIKQMLEPSSVRGTWWILNQYKFP